MSIRIQNDQISDVAASSAGRIDQAGSPLAGGRTGTRSGIGGDSVEVSSITESISTAISTENANRGDRVSQLAALYAGGRYNPDPAEVGKAIVANAIASPPAGDE